MIIDSSAVVAIVRAEEDAAIYAHAIAQADTRRVSVVSFVETSIVTGAIRDPAIDRDLEEFLTAANITIEPVSERQARLARAAYRDFGRGSGHPARLNFGDCFAYALASEFGEPLLYKGSDFAQTDIAAALP